MSNDALNQATRAYIKMCNTKGESHPQTLDALERLANISLEQAQFENALNYYETLLTGLQQQTGESQDRLLSVRERIANTLLKMKQYELAVPVYERLYADCIASRSEQDKLCDTVMLGLVNAYRSAGKSEQLFQFLEPIFEELRMQHQFKHYLVVAFAETLSELYSKREEHEQAVDLMRELYDHSLKKLGTLHDFTLEHLRLLILRLKSASKFVEAIRYSKTLIRAKNRRYGAHSRHLFDVHVVLYRIYDDANMIAESMNMLIELLSNPLYRIEENAHVLQLLEESYQLDYDLMVESKQKVLQIEALISQYPEQSNTRIELERRFAQYKQMSRKHLLLDMKPLSDIVSNQNLRT